MQVENYFVFTRFRRMILGARSDLPGSSYRSKVTRVNSENKAHFNKFMCYFDMRPIVIF